MEWTSLDRQEAAATVERLRGQPNAVVFSPQLTEVVHRPLPFYEDFRLYRLTNYATMPSFTMYMLGDGEEQFYSLDATANPIYTVNEKAPLQLTEGNVVDYLDFFFGNVQGSEGDIFLIKDPKNLPFMSALSPAQQDSINQTYRPISVEEGITPGAFKVKGTLYYDGSLISATIHVEPDGHLHIQDQTLLLQGVHFPSEQTQYSWIAGEKI